MPPMEVNLPLTALTAPCEIEGPIQTRGEAQTNGDLWRFSGQAEAAVIRCNRDKELLRQATTPEKKPRPWWQFWSTK